MNLLGFSRISDRRFKGADMMAHRVITFRMQIHADHVKPDGAMMQLELANDLCGK